MTRWKAPFWLALDSAYLEARMMGAAVFVTEFGAPSVEDKLLEILHQQEAVHPSGSTFWPWKEHGGWGMFTHNASEDPALGEGPMDPAHRQALCRILPLATAGRLHSFQYNWTTEAFAMQAHADEGDGQAPTVVYVPPHVKSRACNVSGAAKLARATTMPDGARHLEVSVSGGDYAVQIAGADGRYHPLPSLPAARPAEELRGALLAAAEAGRGEAWAEWAVSVAASWV